MKVIKLTACWRKPVAKRLISFTAVETIYSVKCNVFFTGLLGL